MIHAICGIITIDDPVAVAIGGNAACHGARGRRRRRWGGWLFGLGTCRKHESRRADQRER